MEERELVSKLFLNFPARLHVDIQVLKSWTEKKKRANQL